MLTLSQSYIYVILFSYIPSKLTKEQLASAFNEVEILVPKCHILFNSNICNDRNLFMTEALIGLLASIFAGFNFNNIEALKSFCFVIAALRQLKF